MKRTTEAQGFTVVELVVVIVVISILAGIVFVSYSASVLEGKTVNGQTIAKQVMIKAKSYYSVKSRYPTYQELKSNTIAGASLTQSSSVLPWINGDGPGGVSNIDTYFEGNNVVYEQCGLGAVAYYWDFTDRDATSAKSESIGEGC